MLWIILKKVTRNVQLRFFFNFQKAFDTVNHDFRFSVLSKFNFGESFKRRVNIMYKNAESRVTNNGCT